MLRSIVVFVLFLSLSSCQNNNEKILVNDVGNQWKKNVPQSFDFEVNDAQNQKNLMFVVRNNNDYPYSNLFLITYLKAENEKNFKIDTLNYIMAKPNGEWLGKGFGETKEILFQYKNQYKFPKKGKYIIGVKQGMRTNSLVGIEDLGVKLENSTQP